MNNVFVYGTLKKEFNHWGSPLEEYNMFVGRIQNVGLFKSVYPCAMDSEGQLIHGEIYTDVGERTLNRLDQIEGHPNFYTRVQRTAVDDEGNEYNVWIYFNEEMCRQGELVETGIY